MTTTTEMPPIPTPPVLPVEVSVEHLLVAVDFQRETKRVLEAALQLAGTFGAQLTLLHVLEPVTDDPDIVLHWGDFPKERHDRALRRLEKLTAETLGDRPASLQLVEGRAYEAIIRAAGDLNAGLLVMGRHSEGSRLLHDWLGGTAEKVARHAPCPVYLVGGEWDEPSTLPQLLLLGTDYTAESLHAFPWALTLARRFDAPVILAHVAEPLGLPGTLEYERFAEQIDALRAGWSDQLDAFRQEHLPVDLPVETRIVEGTPDRALSRLARRERADLIVMASRGRSGWPSWLGGTAEALLREAPGSVLLIPPGPVSEPAGEAPGDAESTAVSRGKPVTATRAGIDLSAPVSSLMRLDFPAIAHQASIGEALSQIRQSGVGERLIYFYVIDSEGRLKGVLPTRRLLTAPLGDPVGSHMIVNVTVLRPNETLLHASDVFSRNKFLALPVIDDTGVLVGVVDVGLMSDRIFDLAEREQIEDIFETIGFNVSQVRDASPLRAFRFRFPWLLATIASGTLCAMLAGAFELTLAKSIVLAFFLTLILGLGESVSIQSMTVAIQALRGITPTLRWYFGALRREVFTAFLLGAGCGTIVAAIVWLWQGEPLVAVSIGGSIVLALVTACVNGLSIPALLHALKLDPKIAAGPVTLALTDIFTLLFYFGMAWWLL